MVSSRTLKMKRSLTDEEEDGRRQETIRHGNTMLSAANPAPMPRFFFWPRVSSP